MNHRLLPPLARPALILGLVALGLVFAACDDTAVDEDFQGALFATYPFDVSNPGGGRTLDEPVEIPEGLRVALFWQVSGLRGVPEVVEHPSTGLEPTERENVLALREPPPSEALMDGVWAIGRLLAYIDTDGDDLKGPDEGIYSELNGAVLLFALRDLDAATSPTGAPLAAGLHRQRLPIVCDPATLPAPTDADCGVPLGSECVADEMSCGAGVCFSVRPGSPTPDFQCALRLHNARDCHPSSAGFRAEWDGDPDLLSGQYMGRCASDLDCPASTGSCDPLGGVCLPGVPQRVILPGDTALIPLCVEDDSPEALVLSYPGPNTRPPPPR